MTENETLLCDEIDNLILRVENKTIDYTNLERARKLVFSIRNESAYCDVCGAEKFDGVCEKCYPHKYY